MSIRDRALSVAVRGANALLDRVERIVGPTRADVTFFQTLRLRLKEAGGPREPFAEHPWVYASVRSIAHAIASLPWRVYQDRISEDTVVTEGPVHDLFRDVNPFMSRFQLWEATLIYLELTGEAYWILEDRDPTTNVPAEIWPFGPDQIEPAIDKDRNLITGFRTREQEPAELGIGDVIYFRYFHPHDVHRGLAPLQSLMATVRQDDVSKQFQEALFKNGADPGGVLISEDELTEDDIRRMRTGWEDRHGGPRKAGRIAILQGGVEYKPLQISNRDIQFVEQRQWHRDEILAAFKVPRAELSVYESLNFATARVSDRGFWQKTLLPKVVLIQDVLRTSLFARISPPGLIGAFDLGVVEALQEQFNEKVETAKILADMGWPINAINKRLQLGMPEVPWGDETLVPFNLAPASTLIGPAADQPEPAAAPERDMRPVHAALLAWMRRMGRRCERGDIPPADEWRSSLAAALAPAIGRARPDLASAEASVRAAACHGLAGSIRRSITMAGVRGDATAIRAIMRCHRRMAGRAAAMIVEAPAPVRAREAS